MKIQWHAWLCCNWEALINSIPRNLNIMLTCVLKSPCSLETSQSSLPSSSFRPPPHFQQSVTGIAVHTFWFKRVPKLVFCYKIKRPLLVFGTLRLWLKFHYIFHGAASDPFTLGDDQYHEFGVTPKRLTAFCWRAHTAASELELTVSRSYRVQFLSRLFFNRSYDMVQKCSGLYFKPALHHTWKVSVFLMVNSNHLRLAIEIHWLWTLAYQKNMRYMAAVYFAAPRTHVSGWHSAVGARKDLS